MALREIDSKYFKILNQSFNSSQAGEKEKWGTNESVFVNILTNRSSRQLQATFEAYKHVSDLYLQSNLWQVPGPTLFRLVSDQNWDASQPMAISRNRAKMNDFELEEQAKRGENRLCAVSLTQTLFSLSLSNSSASEKLKVG